MRLTEAPPTREAPNGVEEFVKVSERFLRYFQAAGLDPQDSILDIGCGSGRMAVALADYVTGRYEGFDVAEDRIAWASQHIGSQRPHFRFQHVKVHNGVYARTVEPARAFAFPYANETFDFAIAISLFTHLLPADVDLYLREAARVIRRGGTLFATFFLLDDHARAQIAAGTAAHLKHPRADGTAVENIERPEAAIGHPRASVIDALGDSGFELGSIAYGSWSNRADSTDFQDFVIATRR